MSRSDEPITHDSRRFFPSGVAIGLSLTLGAALALRLWGIRFGLPHTLVRPDEDTIASVVERILEGHLNPHFFQYPSLYIYAVAALTSLYHALLQGPASFTDAYFAGRALTAILGALTVGCVYRLGRLLFGPAVGILSAACLALAPLHVRDSHFAVTDVAMTFLSVAAVCTLAHLARPDSSARPARRFALAGVLAGLAASTKYNGLFLFAPFFVIAVLDRTALRRRLLTAAWFPLLFVVAFVLTTPFAVLDAQRFLHDVLFEARHLSEGHGIPLGAGWLYHLRVTLPYGLGLPLLACAAAGIALAFVVNIRVALVLFAFPAACYLAAGRSHSVFFRYMIPVLPFLCIAAGLAIERAGHLVARVLFSARQKLRPTPQTTGVAPAFRLAITAVFGAIVLLPSAVTSIRIDRLLARPDSRVLAAEWMRSTLPAGSTLYQTGSPYGQVQVAMPGEQPRFEAWSYDEAARVFSWKGHATPDLPDYVVVQQSPLEQYSRIAPRIEGVIGRHYAPIRRFQGVGTAGEAYDQQDAFYLPMAGFDGIPRPGPTIVVYQRIK